MNDQHTAPADLVRQLADPPSMTCYQGRDHRAGTDSGCPAGGQLTAACARRPCPAVRRLPAVVTSAPRPGLPRPAAITRSTPDE